MHRLHTLAVRMKKGDRRAAGALYDELAPKVHGFVFARTGKREVAEDISQDIFLKLIEKIETFDEQKGTFVVWFWQIARNMLVDYFRRKKEVQFSSFESEDLDHLASYVAYGGVDAKFAHEKLQKFLKTLDEEERHIFELRYTAELSYKEISELLGKSEGALRVATMRVKTKIQKAFIYEA